ncbi:MAG TPA: hypothetical protein VEB22_02835 [Phycisphaerales bacterium]|nr:hypothetical protein [Phycisphaerales bacterium]
MGDDLRRVRVGEPLRIPAGAYNAFVDAALQQRSRGRDARAEAAVDTAQPGIVLVRNDSTEPVEPHHALAITGVLVEPDEEDGERTFHSRTPLTADVATPDAPPLAFVVALQPIQPGELGRCIVSGVTVARVYVRDELDATCELSAGETLLATTPMGGAPILWKEEGTGEKWAVIELGRSSPGRVTAVLGAGILIPTEHNRWRYPWKEARLDGDPGSETYLRYVPVTGGLSSQTPGGGDTDPARMAINRFEAHHMNPPDADAGDGFGGLLGLGPVCELPGVLPNCPPARSLRPRLVPIPEGVCVQLTCERDSLGRPVWVFEAMSLIELADPADGDRKFNLYIPGGS